MNDETPTVHFTDRTGNGFLKLSDIEQTPRRRRVKFGNSTELFPCLEYNALQEDLSMNSTLRKKAVSYFVTAALLLSLSATAMAADTGVGAKRADFEQNKKEVLQGKKRIDQRQKRVRYR